MRLLHRADRLGALGGLLRRLLRSGPARLLGGTGADGLAGALLRGASHDGPIAVGVEASAWCTSQGRPTAGGRSGIGQSTRRRSPPASVAERPAPVEPRGPRPPSRGGDRDRPPPSRRRRPTGPRRAPGARDAGRARSVGRVLRGREPPAGAAIRRGRPRPPEGRRPLHGRACPRAGPRPRTRAPGRGGRGRRPGARQRAGARPAASSPCPPAPDRRIALTGPPRVRHSSSP